jgi:histidine triad (HIT) family protein
VTEEGCVFCGIAAGEVPGDVVRRTERVVAFRDLNPQAPTHVLVIPVDHHADVTAVAAGAPEVLAEMVEVAADVAGRPYRLVFNTGAEVGQTVFHVHAHVLAGRSFGWPPG